VSRSWRTRITAREIPGNPDATAGPCTKEQQASPKDSAGVTEIHLNELLKGFVVRLAETKALLSFVQAAAVEGSGQAVRAIYLIATTSSIGSNAGLLCPSL
jgi:hypothetical protein